jgi:UDP-N-acetylglucosamine 2-epimerase (non-hydrolysing)
VNGGGLQIKRIKVNIVMGTRPEIIKLSMLAGLSDKKIKYTITYTGQHSELGLDLLKTFKLKPNYVLTTFKSGQNLNSLNSKIYLEYANLLQQEKFDAVIVQGDTNSAVMASLSAFYHKTPIIHIEAGLRSHNLMRPFPEEANRKIIDQISKIHFCPTSVSKQNLIREGIGSENIYVIGNTGLDALKKAVESVSIINLEKIDVLVTLHRRENWGINLHNVLKGIDKLSKKYGFLRFKFVTHPNPELNKKVYTFFNQSKNVEVSKPLPYKSMINAIRCSEIVITDSGGIQEECVFLGKKIMIIREESDRPEGLKFKWVSLTKLDEFEIIKSFEELSLMRNPKKGSNVYGDGESSRRIHKVISRII